MEQKLLKVEFRSIPSEDGKMKISGVVNSGNWSKELTWKRKRFFERIDRGVWNKAIERSRVSGDDIKLLFNHQKHSLLASTKNNSLRLHENEDGMLIMEAELCDTSLNRDVYTMIQEGLMEGFSFGFNINENGESWERKNGKNYRTLTDITLNEISCLVVEPAYDETNIYTRSIDDPDEPVEEVVPQPSIDEIIKKAVDMATQSVKKEYETVINDLNTKIDSIRPVEEVKQVEEVKPVEVVEEVKPEPVVEQKVDVSKYIEKIKKLQEMKGAE